VQIAGDECAIHNGRIVVSTGSVVTNAYSVDASADKTYLDGLARANGGTMNEDSTAPNNTFNVASVTINVAASDKNDPPVVNLPGAGATVVVNEDVRKPLTGASAISFTDPDAFNSTTNTANNIFNSTANVANYFTSTT
jgi:hypothetical protein